jgi:hypothetical protein
MAMIGRDESLVALAMTAGGEDDVTALVVRHRVPR